MVIMPLHSAEHELTPEDICKRIESIVLYQRGYIDKQVEKIIIDILKDPRSPLFNKPDDIFEKYEIYLEILVNLNNSFYKEPTGDLKDE